MTSLDNALSEDELRNDVLEARYDIFVLYEQNFKTRDAKDFLEGGCAIFASMLYELFPGLSLIYCSDDHALVQIGNHYYDADDCTRDEEVLYKIKNGEYKPCDLNTEEGRRSFGLFLNNCKLQGEGLYGAVIEDILEELKEKRQRRLKRGR